MNNKRQKQRERKGLQMEPARQTTLDGTEVLLCLTGGIACYKSATLASLLIKAGASVTVAMTNSAEQFIRPLTFQALTNRKVYTELFQPSDEFSSQHISLTSRANLMIIAPATANIIAKIASGLADDLVSTLALSAGSQCPLLLAPAMNDRMYNAPATTDNIAKLISWNMNIIGPSTGRLACGDMGIGRMSEPEDILTSAEKILAYPALPREA